MTDDLAGAMERAIERGRQIHARDLEKLFILLEEIFPGLAKVRKAFPSESNMMFLNFLVGNLDNGDLILHKIIYEDDIEHVIALARELDR